MSLTSLWPVVLLIIANFLGFSNAQVATGQSDRTQQELALLGWTSGVRMAYCQQSSIHDLIDPFKESIARMLNRHCRTPSACGLKKSVTFTKQHVVLLDGFPRREHRAISFRFFVVLPHDAMPMDKRPDKPLLASGILSDTLDTQLAELTQGLGWHLLSHEKYPRFDPTTTFFNRWLILIGVAAGLCMIFLAYWVSSLTSGSSLYADGWLVRGSSGGKNAALRRTMEIIEEQKYRFALYESQKGAMPLGILQPQTKTVVIYKSTARVQEVQAPPKSLATSYSTAQTAEVSRAMPIYSAQEKGGGAGKPQAVGVEQKAVPMPTKEPKKVALRDGTTTVGGKGVPLTAQAPPGSSAVSPQSQLLPQPQQAVPMPAKPSPRPSSIQSAPSGSSKRVPRRQQPMEGPMDAQEMAEMADCVPEIVVMHARDDSLETVDTSATPGGGRKLSAASRDRDHRRQSRRFSIAEEFKRRKSLFGGGSKDRGEHRNRPRAADTQQDRQKRWKASSIALSKFSIVGSGGRNK